MTQVPQANPHDPFTLQAACAQPLGRDLAFAVTRQSGCDVIAVVVYPRAENLAGAPDPVIDALIPTARALATLTNDLGVEAKLMRRIDYLPQLERVLKANAALVAHLSSEVWSQVNEPPKGQVVFLTLNCSLGICSARPLRVAFLPAGEGGSPEMTLAAPANSACH